MKIAIPLIAGFVLLLAGFVTAYAQQDITPPVLLDVKFEPERIDTGNGPATITVTVHVTDDLSGVEDVGLFFRKPGTTQQAQVEFRPGEIIEGDNLDGIHRATFTLPQYSAYGEWELYYFMTMDNVGNRSDIWKPEEGDLDEDWLSIYNGFTFDVASEDAPQQPGLLFMPILLSDTQPLFECSFDAYNCSDFATQSEAQSAFNYCADRGAGDIHRLDQNDDGVACESLPLSFQIIR